MRILYDGEIFSRQRVGGINRYFIELISRLPKEYNSCLTIVSSSHSTLPQNPGLKIYPYKRFGIKPGRLSFAIEPYYFRLLENLVSPDIFHPTYHYLLTRKKLAKRKIPTVLTVYDLLQERFPELIDPQRIEIQFKQAAILAADAIICISENTKKDLLNYYDVSQDKVFVTHLASDLKCTEDIQNIDRRLSQKPYLLYVGSRLKHKNFLALLYAFHNVSQSIQDLDLFVVSSPFSQQEQKTIEEKKLTDKIHLISYINDNYLSQLYRNCLGFIYPSVYEGFGIPLLEAMQCHAPIIASNTSSIPEVVDDAALLFDPYSIDDLTDKIRYLVNDIDMREKLITKGIERVKSFSWDNTVNKTLEVYNYFKKS